MGLPCELANRFVEHLDVGVFIDVPDHLNLSPTEGEWVRHTEGYGIVRRSHACAASDGLACG